MQGGAKLLVAPRAQGPRVVAGLNTEGEVIRRVVAANNHCLFTSLGYVLEDHNRDAGLKLRQVIADVVKSDPETYNAVFLDQSNEDYVKFILNPESWGGAIELSILCKYYQTEIAAVDVQSLRTDVYGQGEGYPEARPTLAPMGRNDLTLLVINRLFTCRVLLLYDGIHYDPLALTFDASLPEECDVTVFSVDDDYVMAKARAKKKFTDTARFTLQCMICYEGLTGQQAAVAHAQKTGHTNFGEVGP
ncbi:deubiquinating enzyme, putative [Acanthamoeba castellanii str. Neff]|uniref:Ubiquitin thioesterase OTU n=1 Tax=Acanthamoeba castellanii (strain ATCC 30010 / Neff) TaxID=1257118 RepID=L8H0P1_ACACF|nr:deubiquinating enzyme, putative [Acanthamoeba castellanii str. Neff]ELR18338.1 deubiquinating enzyme, putative [Acanthamoeba castellanii str. Neff]